MNNNNLALKLRPAQFKDLVGQPYIQQILKTAVSQNKTAPVFLFCGPRGVGKTSCARILAKALNCLNLLEGEPCNECEHCKEIQAQAFVDLLEIDAASNRGIEHIRDLKDKIRFSTVKGRFRVYIIDEVHMLTIEAFNALLKTLEEPPAHVRFILATTEVHKIPLTVTSRCQRYDFSAMSVADILPVLNNIVQQAEIEIAPSILQLIAESAAGSMRDALMMLEVLLAFGQPKIEEDLGLRILGKISPDLVLSMLETIADQDSLKCLGHLNQVLEAGQQLRLLVAELLKLVKDISLFQVLGAQNTYWQNLPTQAKPRYQELANKCTKAQLQQYFELLIEVDAWIKKSEYPQHCVQMGLLKMCEVQALVGISELLSHLKNAKQHVSSNSANVGLNTLITKDTKPTDVKPAQPLPPKKKLNTEFSSYSEAKRWEVLVANIKDVNLKSWLFNAGLDSFTPSQIKLCISADITYTLSPEQKNELQNLTDDLWGIKPEIFLHTEKADTNLKTLYTKEQSALENAEKQKKQQAIESTAVKAVQEIFEGSKIHKINLKKDV